MPPNRTAYILTTRYSLLPGLMNRSAVFLSMRPSRSNCLIDSSNVRMPSARPVRMTVSIESSLLKRIDAAMAELLNMTSSARTRFSSSSTFGNRC